MNTIFDEEGFAVSFDISQNEEILNFFDIYGFVVIKNVLDEEEIHDTIDEFYSSFENKDKASDIELNKFYADQPFGHLGIIGTGPDLSSISQLNNRQNPMVYQAFSTVLKSKDLIVEHDRLGVLRPSENKPEWRTRDKWIHLDCNPQTGHASIGGFNVENYEPIDFNKTLI